MDTPQIDVVRALRPAPEIRSAADDDTAGRTMVGHFSVFDTWYEVNSMFEGHFLERTASGAFNETIGTDRSNVKVTFNHGYDVLGDQVLGNIDVLREDDTGPYYEVPLFRSVPDLIVEGLEAGVYGSSFRFRVTGEEWDDEPGESSHNPKGIPERTITKVRLMEFGPVTFPANPDATAGVRSMTDDYYERLRDRSPSQFEAACRAAQIPTGRPDTRSAGGGGANDTSEVSPDPQPPAAPPTPQERTVETTTLTVEERVARQAEITARQTEIDAEYNGAALPDDAQAEWDRLDEEFAEHERAVKAAETRRARLAERAQSTGSTERAGDTPQYGAPAVRKTTDPYNLTEIRRQANSVDDLADLYRDNALRSIERSTFPGTTREAAQANIERLLNEVDDKHGTLARRILVTGSPVYNRAFGKAVMQGSTAGLTPEEQRALAVGGTANLAVPYQLDPTVILSSSGSINPLRQLARVVQIVGKEWQGITSTGVTVSRVAEATEATDGAPTFVQPTVKPERVQGFVPFSIEIDEDWNTMRSEITTLLNDAKEQEEASSFVNGTGVSPQANGLLQTLGAGSNVTQDTITAAAVYALESALPPRFRGNAVFLAEKSVYNAIRQLDTAGGAQLWERIGARMPGELLGYPAYELSTMPDSTLVIGDKWLLLGDLSQFLIVDRVGMGVELVPHLFGAANRFPTGQRGIFAIWRNNSKILVDNAFRVARKNA